MVKIFYLYHEYPINEHTVSQKTIGFFTTKIEAESIIKEYKIKPGFNEYKNNFIIKELIVDNGLNCSNNFSDVKNYDRIYTLYEISNLNDSNEDYYILLGCFSSKNKAEFFNDYYRSRFNTKASIHTEIFKERIGVLGWCDGFKAGESGQQQSEDGSMIEP